MIKISAFNKISENLWEIPQNFSPHMLVSARIYASQKISEDALHEIAVNFEKTKCNE